MVYRFTKTTGAIALIFLLVMVACSTEAPNTEIITKSAAPDAPEPTTPVVPATTDTTSVTEPETTSTNSAPTPVTTVVITGENFKFIVDGEDNPDIRVNVGDTVRIEFKSTSGFHDWVVDELNAATDRVSSGGSTVVEFVANKEGTFEYYCSVGSHRAQGMKGKLLVTK